MEREVSEVNQPRSAAAVLQYADRLSATVEVNEFTHSGSETNVGIDIDIQHASGPIDVWVNDKVVFTYEPPTDEAPAANEPEQSPQ